MGQDIAFQDYRTKFPAKSMRIQAKHRSELLPMVVGCDGCELFDSAPISCRIEIIYSAPRTAEDGKDQRHLWVIRSSDLPFALEKCAFATNVEGNAIKHSNLTGGRDAHSGGEIWFLSASKIVVNANSGRYGAETKEEFEKIVAAFRACGYWVLSMGWDIDNLARPNSVYIGTENWLAPIKNGDT